jgi:hypothetical protein
LKMNWGAAELNPNEERMLWHALPHETRAALIGKLSGLWGAVSDEAAFNGFAVDKQQALLLFVSCLQAKGLWQAVRKIDNVYGEGGVGIGFAAWPVIKSSLERRKDFTRLLANHRGAAGGFYEKGRAGAILHFLYDRAEPPKWYVHFDLYSPVHSIMSALKHFRYEILGKVTPDWRMIAKRLHAESSQRGA